MVLRTRYLARRELLQAIQRGPAALNEDPAQLALGLVIARRIRGEHVDLGVEACLAQAVRDHSVLLAVLGAPQVRHADLDRRPVVLKESTRPPGQSCVLHELLGPPW